MAVTVSKSKWIEFAHFMPGHPVEANRRIHGHSAKVTIRADMADGPFPDIDVYYCNIEAIVGMLDHRFLNEEHPEIDPPTLENIAAWIGERISICGNFRTLSVIVSRPSRSEFVEWSP